MKSMSVTALRVKLHRPLGSQRNRRSGFTLVEMLVSVALVVLMMTLFASIFQLATGAMSTQKGLAENDQRSRLVLNALRNDLSRRTMKLVLPFAAAEDVTQPGAQMALRQGYFYVREGNPDDPTDDILQLTVATNPGEDPFFGVWGRRLNASGQLEALLLPDPNGNLGDQATGFWRNQPEFDDGAADLNFAASSPRAEVSYFLRNGSLYRRVLLIRQPTSPSGATSGQPQEGEQALNLGLFQASGLGNGSPSQKFANFHACADFSAYLEPSSNLLKFHGAASLDNSGSWLSVSLGNPRYRFGHSSFGVVVDGSGTRSPMPREVATFSSASYFGRFTQEETSAYSYTDPSQGFGYPGRVTAGSPNPYDFATPLNYNADAGKIVEYAGGLRAGEDLLMTNVHRFDIKLWDPGLHPGPDLAAGREGIDDDGNGVTDVLTNGQPDPGELGYPGSDDGGFIDLGHAGTRGFYRASALQNLGYCSDGAFRFDTWHPQIKFSANARPLSPPFRAALPGKDGLPGDPNFDDDQNTQTDYGANGLDRNELGWPGTDDIALPLKAIQIRITFFENSTRQLRDVTLLFPLQSGLQ